MSIFGSLFGGSIYSPNQTWTSPNTSVVPWQSTTTTILPGQRKVRRKTVWDKLVAEASKLPKQATGEDVSDYYSGASTDIVVEHFGKYNPMYAKRPKRMVMRLLLAGPSSVSLYMQHQLKHAGLVTTEPCIPGRRKTRCRLSLAGVALMDYWAEKHPAFKPFVDAYLPYKARIEITQDGVDFAMGALPPHITTLLDKAKDELEKERVREVAALAKQMMAKQMKAEADNYYQTQQAHQLWGYLQQQMPVSSSLQMQSVPSANATVFRNGKKSVTVPNKELEDGDLNKLAAYFGKIV